MKFLSALLLVFTIAHTATAQPTAREKEFLQQVLGGKKVKLYTNGLHINTYAMLRKELLKDTIKHQAGIVDLKHPQFIVFTKVEKSYISNHITKPQTRWWYAHAFPSAKLIERAEIDSFLTDRPLGLYHLSEKYQGKIYAIMPPIFLRADLCLFYWEYSCGNLCGMGELNVYRKENGVWKRWLELTNWIS